jgi:hypothetical protein
MQKILLPEAGKISVAHRRFRPAADETVSVP